MLAQGQRVGALVCLLVAGCSDVDTTVTQRFALMETSPEPSDAVAAEGTGEALPPSDAIVPEPNEPVAEETTSEEEPSSERPAAADAGEELVTNNAVVVDLLSDSPLVRTPDGALRGVATGGVEQFLGIPYAAPPVGALRFAPPAAPQPWTGQRDATRAGPVCQQPAAVIGGIAGREDCLTLNVHRPSRRAADEPLPVMVWIHGGSFRTGAGSIYDPRRLVEANDIIVVTLNYRLGALGFMALPPPTAESPEGLPGNYGLMDQQAALRWVQTSIGAFGGDPEQVTIAGQSAGGASVCAQLAAPSSAGLVARAIVQSASCASGPLAFAEQQGTSVAQALGCTEPLSAASCLRALPAAQLTASGGAAGPVVGGEFLPRAPIAVVVEGSQLPVPVLVGGMSDEMRGFAAEAFPLDPARYPAVFSEYFPNRAVDEIAARYPLEDYPQAYDALSAALSDSGWFQFGSLGGCVTSALADLLSTSTTTYAYEMDDPAFVWSPSVSLVRAPTGATHSSDLAFLFDTVGFTLNEPLGAAQQTLADQMVLAWGAFIRGDEPNASGLDVWPAYDLTARRMLHLEPGASGVVTDFRQRHHCDYWETPPAGNP
jgi:para-nitrobenzyl esterase